MQRVERLELVIKLLVNKRVHVSLHDQRCYKCDQEVWFEAFLF